MRTALNRDKVHKQNLRELKEREISERAAKSTSGGHGASLQDHKAEVAAAQQREDYLERRRANKERIEAALSKRPSLMERHRRDMQAQAAADRALGIVGDAMVTTVYTKAKSGRGRDRDRDRDGGRNRDKENRAPWRGVGEEKAEGKYADEDEDDRYYRAAEEFKNKEEYEYGHGTERRHREKHLDYRDSLLDRAEQTMLGMRD